MCSTWSFSSSAEPYLQRFIAAVAPPYTNNKWFQKFGAKSMSDTTKTEEYTTIIASNSPQERNAAICDEDFLDTISCESTVSAEYVLQECSINPALVPKAAEKLSSNAVEQLFVYIFSKVEGVPSKFIITFLFSYIKVQYSRLCIELLVKLYERHPDIFKELLELLLNDVVDVPSTVLNDYISGLNEETATEFMNIILSTDITAEGFAQNVLPFYTAYKNCTKDDSIQNYVKKFIIVHGKNCTTDRSFGRLLVTFLQTEKAQNRRVCDNIQQCVHEHRSLFKRSCMLLLEELANK